MLHFSFLQNGYRASEALYHHAEDLWKVLRQFCFTDGRLWRIGGDTRVRYCYCQDYALNMWAWVQNKLGESTRHLSEGWLSQVLLEQTENEDGSYLKTRLAEMKRISPLYYSR